MDDRKGWLTAGRDMIELQVPGIRQMNNVVHWILVRGYGLSSERQKGRVERSSTNRAGDLKNYILLLDLGLPQELEITRRREEDQAFIQVLRPKPTLNDDFDGTDCYPHRHPYRRPSTGTGQQILMVVWVAWISWEVVMQIRNLKSAGNTSLVTFLDLYNFFVAPVTPMPTVRTRSQRSV
ncbi:hypothetical protein BC629DRAFT_1725806 [Irpex lacteus]|nr:hypothetical protein BC629DRAFT_1725806 [Irpex lacteus]